MKPTSRPSHDLSKGEPSERVDAIEPTTSKRRDYSSPSSRVGVGALAPLRGSARRDKEALFVAAVPLLDPHARQALEELNTYLLLGTGEVTATGVRSSTDRGIEAVWALSWPEQRAAGVEPILIRAYFGSAFSHPHLQSGSAGDWPLNVFDEEQAAEELPTLRAMAAADLHNLVFRLGGDVRVIPATVKGLDG
jgi:hypothetical protein